MADFKMSSVELNRTNIQVDEVNKKAGRPGGVRSGMDKDAFLKLLVTQLSHQDPTKPMEDREFVSQMAQFSSLEQMNNMNTEMKSLIRSSEASQAYNLLGRTVDAVNPATKETMTGEVSSVYFEEGRVMLKVGNGAIGLSDVLSVHRASAGPSYEAGAAE